MRARLGQSRPAPVVSDPRREDTRLVAVAVADAFRELTGYGGDEVLGRDCRVLRGLGTDREEVERPAVAVGERRTAHSELLTCREDGTPFWDVLHMGPVCDEGGEPIHVSGTRWDVAEEVEALRMLRGRTRITDQRRSKPP